MNRFKQHVCSLPEPVPTFQRKVTCDQVVLLDPNTVPLPGPVMRTRVTEKLSGLHGTKVRRFHITLAS